MREMAVLVSVLAKVVVNLILMDLVSSQRRRIVGRMSSREFQNAMMFHKQWFAVASVNLAGQAVRIVCARTMARAILSLGNVTAPKVTMDSSANNHAQV